MSDPPRIATVLAEKFDYTNTFYHQAPRFDVVHPDPTDFGRYDFVLSSEVMEHVQPPIEEAFSNLYNILKPDGLLLLTVPYNLSSSSEHFPTLHQFDLAAPGGRVVLVNRRPDGKIETFEDLIFHVGDGLTLEMRRFKECELRQMLVDAGFHSILVASEKNSEFGIEHATAWDLPIVARKGNFTLPNRELAASYHEATLRASVFESEYKRIRVEYEKFVAFHEREHAETRRELEARTNWARSLEQELAAYATIAQELAECRDTAQRLNQNVCGRILRRLRLIS